MLEHVEYIVFKNWLKEHYPQFIEVNHHEWLTQKNKKVATVCLRRNQETLLQYASVGFQDKDSGWGCPCYTFEELGKRIDKALKDLGIENEQTSLF